MRTLHVGIRVADLDRSLAFYSALGYEEVGRVPDSPIGDLVMLKLPGDDFVAIELVYDPGRHPQPRPGLSHLVVQVESMKAAIAELIAHGIQAGPPSSPNGAGDFLTCTLHDPDGNEIELVQWPVDHPDGMTAGDFMSSPPHRETQAR